MHTNNQENTENEEKTKEKKIGVKLWEGVKWLFGRNNMTWLYPTLASATIIGAYIEKLQDDKPKEKLEPQIIIIKEDKGGKEEIRQNKNEIYTEVSITEQKPKTMQIRENSNSSTNKIDKQEDIVIKPEITSTKNPEEKAVEPPTEENFGFIKNTNKNEKSSTVNKNQQILQTFGKGYVLGDYKPIQGSTIKIKLTEDMIYSNSIISMNTVFTGLIEIKGNRIYAELKDKSGKTIFLCDKNHLLGLAKQEKIPDGLNISVTNLNQ